MTHCIGKQCSTRSTPVGKHHSQSSRHKGKEAMATGTAPHQKPQDQKGKNTFKPHFVLMYAFKYDQTVMLFHLPNKRGMLQFLSNPNLEEVRKTNDPKYCLYHQNLGHPTKDCYTLQNKIQVLIETKVI